MLDKQFAGGGSTLNVGVHFIDLISSLTNSPITQVTAQMQTYRPDVTVEEQAVFTCRTAAGQIGVIETEYLYPSTAEDQRDFAFSISHANSYVRGFSDQFYKKSRDQQQGRSETVEYNTDAYYFGNPGQIFRSVDLPSQVCERLSMLSRLSRRDIVRRRTVELLRKCDLSPIFPQFFRRVLR